MKYLNEGGFQNNPLMRLTLGFTLFLLIGFWISSWLMYFQRMDLTSASVAQYYLGNEAEFQAPLSLESLIETTHMHMPMMGMVLLFLTHLVIFIPMKRAHKITIIAATFLSSVFQELAGYLVRYVSADFAWLKISAFLTLQVIMGFLIIVLGGYLWAQSRKQKQALALEL